MAEHGAAKLHEQLDAALQAAALSGAAAAAAEAHAGVLTSQVADLKRHEAELVQHNDDLATHLVRRVGLSSVNVTCSTAAVHLPACGACWTVLRTMPLRVLSWGRCALQAEVQDSLRGPDRLRPRERLVLSPAALRRATSAFLPRQQSPQSGAGCSSPVIPASRGGESRPQLWLSRVALRRLSAVDPAAAAAAVSQEIAGTPEQDDAASIGLSLELAVLERLQA